jgi:hypothetical protein
VLLAVKKNFDFKSFFKKIDISEKLAKIYFNFVKNQLEFDYLIQEFDIDLVLLGGNYDFFYNSFSDYDVDKELQGTNFKEENWGEVDHIDAWREIDQSRLKIINYIKKEAKENLIIIFYGNAHRGPHKIDFPQLYTREEVKSIFQSENTDLTRSLIINDILSQLEFTQQEIDDLITTFKKKQKSE